MEESREPEGINLERRQFLATATSVLGGVGLGAALGPFVSSWKPSVRTEALGSPVTVDISHLEVGQKLTVSWRGQPVFVIRRSQEELARLSALDTLLRDPTSEQSVQPEAARNRYRSLKQEYLVLMGVCTHLGCVPLFEPVPNQVEADWPGGFFCPCHGSKYDLAGRVYKGVPAPLNLAVPPYYFQKETLLVIGEEKNEGVA